MIISIFLIFSSGQKIFSIVFIILFVVAMIWAYRSDSEIIKKYYKNVWVVLISILAILVGIIILSQLLH